MRPSSSSMRASSRTPTRRRSLRLCQTLRKELRDRVVAAHAVRELEDVVTLVVEDEVLDVVAASAQLVDEVVRLALDDARVVAALDHEQRRLDLVDVRLRRALDEEVAVAFGIAEHEREIRLPRLRDAIDEREQVIRAEHVDGAAPELRVAARERQGHVAAV